MNEATINSEMISLPALQAGDQRELARLVDIYSERVYRLALKILNDPQDAEDILQETFLKAMRALPSFEGRSSLSTWIYRIATNEALMLLRKRKHGNFSLDDVKYDESEEGERELQIIDWCCLPERELISGEARKFLDKAIESLPDLLKLVFILRDMDGLSIRETAEALNLTDVTVKTRLLRARLFLRDKLSTYYAERIKSR
jgi:RNA polymerase sigma-70 factor (ECF subfamily)